jgi:C4-type Zn-finger protein
VKELPYPAKRCGLFLVICDKCGYSAAITTAGRPDDPRKVTLPCKLN